MMGKKSAMSRTSSFGSVRSDIAARDWIRRFSASVSELYNRVLDADEALGRWKPGRYYGGDSIDKSVGPLCIRSISIRSITVYSLRILVSPADPDDGHDEVGGEILDST